MEFLYIVIAIAVFILADSHRNNHSNSGVYPVYYYYMGPNCSQPPCWHKTEQEALDCNEQSNI